MTLKILVVDDEPDLEPLILQKFRKRIRNGEMDFAFARNGVEALRMLETDPDIQLVLSDINMPVMDGLTLLSRLNEMPRLLKTVVVSAYNDMMNLRVAMNRGAYDFVTKPIDFEDLEATVHKTHRELELLREYRTERERLTSLQTELEVAEKIQRWLLPPPLLTCENVELAAMMLPARQVSGDFYDFFALDDGRIGVVIGDVSGKGIPAAIFMAVARTVIRTTALQGYPPHECLSAANRVLVPQSGGQMFVTLFYAILDPQSGSATYSIGGHVPPWLLPANGPPRQLNELRGFMVGLFENAIYGCATLQLQPGDALLLHTDGVTDAENASGEMLRRDGLLNVLRGLRSNCALEAVERVAEAVQKFGSGAPQSDDVTLLAVRFDPVPVNRNIPNALSPPQT
jgi:phosphoserine phosphatase RsbU/P